MTIHLTPKKVSLFTVPKCVSTSLKEMFFEYENGHSVMALKVNGRPMPLSFVHHCYPTAGFRNMQRGAGRQSWKTAVLRDPVSRVLSAYGNRIVKGKGIKDAELTEDQRRKGMSTMPDLQNFLHFFEEYRTSSRSVMVHCGLLRWYLGDDASYYDRLFTVREIGPLMDELTSRLGELPTLPHRMAEGPKFKASDLTAAETNKIKRLFARDYELYGSHFEAMVEA